MPQEALGWLCLTPPVPIFIQIKEGTDHEKTSTGVLQMRCPEEKRRQRQVQVLRAITAHPKVIYCPSPFPCQVSSYSLLPSCLCCSTILHDTARDS